MSLQQIEREAWRLMREHGLVDHGWVFKWDHAVKRAGLCSYRTRTISLSRKIFSVPANQHDAINTILHEIAHALVPGEGHGPYWRMKAREIGCTGNRCHSLDVTALTKYVGECRCGPIHGRARQVKRTYGCSKCRSLITWRLR